MISCALSRVDRRVVAGRRACDAATIAASSSAVSGAIRESGGTSRVAASGVGMPLGDSTVTSASPMPSVVIVRSTS